MGIDLAAAAIFLEHALHHRLDRVEHVLLADKGHFHVQLVEIRWAAVGARILVAETGRDLEILVKAADHDQLLELLRRLRQRIELARMQTAGNKKIARTFGARRGDDRRLIFAEPLVPHPLADRCDNVRPQRHVALHRLAPQVQEPVAQARFFRVFLITKDDQRQFLRRAQHLDIADEHLDFTGGELRIHQACIARLHLAIDADAPFRPHLVHLGKDWAVGVAQDLRDPVMVAQIDEKHPAVVADAMHPAGQSNGVADMCRCQICASMGAKGVHGHAP